MEILIRSAGTDDIGAIERIQAASPEAARWNPRDYLAYDCRVAEKDGDTAGFLVSRDLGGAEIELLNLAVAPGFRRRGVGRALVAELIRRSRGDIFLEVRASNLGALAFYAALGFQPAGRRSGYYQGPEEDAVVMKFLSC